MAKLITKFKYLKPSDKRSPGGYAKYIATREGVEKIDDSQRFAPETKRQRQFIQKSFQTSRRAPPYWSTKTI